MKERRPAFPTVSYAALALACAAVLCGPARAARAQSAEELPQTLAESSLPLRLVGTIVSAPSRSSLAMIEDRAAQRVVVVGVGATLGSTRIERIAPDAVVLRRGGRLERISLRSGSPSLGRAGSAPTAASAASGPVGTPGAETRDSRVPAPRPGATARATASSTPPAASDEDAAAAVDRERPDWSTPEEALQDLAQQAVFVPELGEGGRVRGIAVADIRPGSLLERLGLENGDVVVAIAGVRVESGSQALQALRGLDFHRGVSVDVERDGALTAIAVPAGAL